MRGIIARTFKKIILEDIDDSEFTSLLSNFEENFEKGRKTCTKKDKRDTSNLKNNYIRLMSPKININYIKEVNFLNIIQFLSSTEYRNHLCLLETLFVVVKNVLVADKLFNIIEYLLILNSNIRNIKETQTEKLRKFIHSCLSFVANVTNVSELNSLLNEDYTILYRAIEQNNLQIAKMLVEVRCNICENISQKSVNKKTILCWYIDNLYSNMRTLSIDELNKHKDLIESIFIQNNIYKSCTRIQRNKIVKIQYYYNRINPEAYFTIGIKENIHINNIICKYSSNKENIIGEVREMLNKEEVLDINFVLGILERAVDVYVSYTEDHTISFVSFLKNFEPNLREYTVHALKGFFDKHVNFLLILLLEKYPTKKNEISILFSYISIDHKGLFDYAVTKNNSTIMYILLDIYFNNSDISKMFRIKFLNKRMITNYKQTSLIMQYLNEDYAEVKMLCLFNVIFSFKQIDEKLLKTIPLKEKMKKYEYILSCAEDIIINEQFIDYIVSNKLKVIADSILNSKYLKCNSKICYYIEKVWSSGCIKRLIKYVLSIETCEGRKQKFNCIIERAFEIDSPRVLTILLEIIDEANEIKPLLLFIDSVDVLEYKEHILEMLKKYKDEKDQLLIIEFLSNNEASSNRLKVELFKELIGVFNIKILSNNKCLLQNCIRCSNLMCLTDILKVHPDLLCEKCPGKDDFLTISSMVAFELSSKRLNDAKEYLYQTMIEHGFNPEEYSIPQRTTKTVLRRRITEYNKGLLKDIGKKRKRDITIEDVFPIQLKKTRSYIIEDQTTNIIKKDTKLSLKIEKFKEEVLKEKTDILTRPELQIILNKLFDTRCL